MKAKDLCHLIPLVLLLAILLCACGKDGSDNSGSTLTVYRPVKVEYRTTGELIRSEKISLGKDAEPVQGAAYAISALAVDDEMESILPDGVEIVSAEQNGRVAKVTMNASYRTLDGMRKTIADYCITLTMCSIPQVDYVSIYVGSDIIESHLTASDVILGNTVVSTDEAGVRVYFPHLSGGLGYEYRTITVSDDNIPERLIMDVLIAGPESEQLTAAFFKKPVLLSVYTNQRCLLRQLCRWLPLRRVTHRREHTTFSIFNSEFPDQSCRRRQRPDPDRRQAGRQHRRL